MKRLLFLFLLFTPTVYAEETASMAIPACGIASAYGTFVNLDLDISLNEITKRYQDLFPGEDPYLMPLSQLQSLIQSFGLHTLAVQGDLAALDNSYLPAILCIVNTPNGRLLPVGHVVLLRSIQGNMATYTDYQIGAETRTAPLDRLQAVSGGRVILVSKNPISLPFPWMTVALWFTVFTSSLGIVYVVCSWRQDRKEEKTMPPTAQSAKDALALLILFLFVSGCGKADSSPSVELGVSETVATTTESTPPASTPSRTRIINPFKLVFPERSPAGSLLLFEKLVQDFGEFQVGRDAFRVGPGGGKIEFEFPFKVGSADVVITKIDASCGCMASDLPIIGQTLPAESEQNLTLTIDLWGRSGEFSAFAHIVTKPEPKEPIMLKMVVFVKQLPGVVPSEIRCRGIAGKAVVNVELNVHYTRDESVDKMELDLENSDFGKFRLVHSEFVSEASILQPKEIKDRVLLKLESEEPYTIGQHEDELTIRFKGDFEPITVPVRIQIVPSIALAVERLFVGMVAPGEEKTMPVRVTVNNTEQAPTVRIISVDENVQTEFDEQAMRLSVTVKAPQETGRFEKNMRLTFGADDSAFDFPISGVVQER